MDEEVTAIRSLICGIIHQAAKDYKKAAIYIIKHSDYDTETGAKKQRLFNAIKRRIKKLRFNLKGIPVSHEERAAFEELEKDKDRVRYVRYHKAKKLKEECEEFFNGDYINELCESINGKAILAELDRQINDKIAEEIL